MIQVRVAAKLEEYELKKSGRYTYTMNEEDGPLAPRVYAESMVDFKYPNHLPSFRGSGDSQDPQSFIFGFRERLRLQGASDSVMCRVFTTCLEGEAWEWYMRLPRKSINRFDDLVKAFLTRYLAVRQPRVTCEMLFDIEQGPKEGTGKFLERFMHASRKVHDLNEEVAIAALRKGLRRGGVGTLRHDAHLKEIHTLGEFLKLAEGYIRAENDVRDTIQSRSRSPRQLSNGWQGRHIGLQSNRGEGRQKNTFSNKLDLLRQPDDPRRNNHDKKEIRPRNNEYRQHYTNYAKFNTTAPELYHIALERFRMPRPLPKAIFEVKNSNVKCLFHGFHGHSTEDCQQLRDILERLAREGKLPEFLDPRFFQQYKRRYDGTGQDYRKKIPYRDDYAGPRHQLPNTRDNHRTEQRQQSPPRSPVIHVISGGHRDTAYKPKAHHGVKPFPTVMTVEQDIDRKRPRHDEVISFSEKDMKHVTWPHEDPIVLSLKIGIHRVKRILIDTGSSADILYWSTFKQMGGKMMDLQGGVSPLVGFTGDTLQPRGIAQFKVIFGTPPRTVEVLVDFLVVNAPSTYNAIIGRSTLNKIGAIVSSPHLKVKFHTPTGVGEECGQQDVARECYMTSIREIGGTVHQVDRGSASKHKGKGQKNEFMPPGTVLVLDPKDQSPPRSAEPVDEVDQVEVAPGKLLNVGNVSL
ncbi:uncharacterized protein LOC144548163 [Carex rostrata]